MLEHLWTWVRLWGSGLLNVSDPPFGFTAGSILVLSLSVLNTQLGRRTCPNFNIHLTTPTLIYCHLALTENIIHSLLHRHH